MSITRLKQPSELVFSVCLARQLFAHCQVIIVPVDIPLVQLTYLWQLWYFIGSFWAEVSELLVVG